MTDVERIVPSELDGDEMWRRNSEYVSADAYDAAMKRVAHLEQALRIIAGEQQCVDNLMGNADIAREALKP